MTFLVNIIRENPSFRILVFGIVAVVFHGCSTAGKYREDIDKTAYKIIEQKQMEALGKAEPFSVEPPAVTLRRRLMIDQNLPYAHPSSLGTKDLEPIEHWPKDDYLNAGEEISVATGTYSEPLRLKLIDVLQIAAQNNRTYQSQKENVFRSALNLDLQRDQFRNTFTGSMESTFSTNLADKNATYGSENSGGLNLSRRFLNGMTLSTRIGMDLVKMLNPFSASSYSLFGDASISIPLMRGAGKHIVAEPLIQSERDALYSIYDFERYKREFAVNITRYYLSALQSIDRIENAKASYERAIRSTRYIRRQADAGKQKPYEVDQAFQSEYNARISWMSSEFGYEDSLDSLKTQLGLPPDAQIELDREELGRLTQSALSIIKDVTIAADEEEVPPADAPVSYPPISRENAGPYELEEDLAIQLSLENRLDLRAQLGNVYDSQRAVVIAADDLRAELTLLGSTSFGQGRSLGSAGSPSTIDPDFEKGRYNALLSLDLPIERTREIVSYRQSILNLERAVRDYQNLEDSIKLNIRASLRDLHESRENLQTAALQVMLNERRVTMMDLLLQAGRAVIRDVLDAQRDLVNSQNSLTTAMVNYRLAELGLQRDLDVLEIDPDGIWKEISPEELKNERQSE